MGVTYDLRIHDTTTDELIHADSGQWLWNKVPGVDPQWQVTRTGVIPHGVVVVALGGNASLSGDEVKAEQQAMLDAPAWCSEPQHGRINAGLFRG